MERPQGRNEGDQGLRQEIFKGRRITLLNIVRRRGPQPSRTPLSRDDHSNASENRSLFRLETPALSGL